MKNLRKKIPVLLFAVLFLTACGGGGSSTSVSSGLTISGLASKGPVNGGTVSVYSVNPDGSKGSLIGTGTTGSDGSYNIDVGAYSGNVLVEVTGGTYTDEATGSTVTNGTLRAAKESAAGNISISVTAFTEASVQNMEGTYTSSSISGANQKVSNVLGGIDIIATTPSDATDPASSGDSNDEKSYGLMLAAISQRAYDASQDVFTVISSVASDISDDGLLDDTGTALSGSFNTFVSSASNETGVTASDTNMDEQINIATVGGYPIVDTNQTTCYDSTSGQTTACVGTGYDADYSGNQPSYMMSDDGKTVTDNMTELVWTQTPDLDGNGVVNVSDKLSQSEAVSYCNNLTTGGYDWRLPSIKELYSLMDFRGGDPSGYQGTDTSALTPFMDGTVFEPGFGDQGANERIIDGQYATTTLYVSPEGTMGGNATMFGVNFIDGRIKGYPYEHKTFYVMCVSGNTLYGLNNFVDNGDETVSDRATGLTWQKNDSLSTDWEDAVSICESATTATYTTWRLPNVKELQSIVDYSRSPDSTNSAAIDPVFNSTSFTNEEGQTDWGYYWASTTHVTWDGYGTAATYVSFGRAVGYYHDPVSQILYYDDVHGAGAQRSNNKMTTSNEPGASSANLGYGTFYYKGPQGDILRINNRVRCVMEGYGA